MKFLKKAIPLCLLALVLVVCITLLTPKTHAAISGDFEYTVSNGKATIVDYTGSAVDLVIPDTLGGYPVTVIGYQAFKGNSNLQSVTIPDGVKYMEERVFRDCFNLQSVTIPESVTSIGDSTFYNCTSLTGVYITNIAAWCNISYGDSYANPLWYANNLYLNDVLVTNLVIPDSVTSIRYSAFAICTSLQSITIPDSVTSVGYSAFQGCSNLQSVSISDSVTKIDELAFHNCSSLTDVYYAGSQTKWSNISIGSRNTPLTSANIHYNHIHNYTLIPPVILVEPTCTQVGSVEYTCMYGETYQETLPALGHSKGAVIEVVAPTCTQQGYTRYACARCGEIFTSDDIPALGHDFNGTVTVIVGCTTQGYTQTQCTRCEATQKTNYTDSVGHNVVVIQLRDATCTQQGISKIGTMCDRCHEVFIEPTYTPALGHEYADGVCIRCQEPDPDYVPEAIVGDLDGNGQADNNDVVALMWHVLFPELYPLNVSADLDHNGQADNNDVIALMWYVLFPDLYPLD